MSRSRNTEKEKIRAKHKIKRTEDGEICIPRIVARRPAHGDIHPLSKSLLRGALKKIPIEYLYGLTRIELRPREGSRIGYPFGTYRTKEKYIILYSLPLEWTLDQMTEYLQKDVEFYRASVTRRGNKWKVHWPSEMSLAVWFFQVLRHELGHHFAEQYKKKRGKIVGVKYNELNAELHSIRLTEEMFKKIAAKRKTKKKVIKKAKKKAKKAKKNN